MNQVIKSKVQYQDELLRACLDDFGVYIERIEKSISEKLAHEALNKLIAEALTKIEKFVEYEYCRFRYIHNHIVKQYTIRLISLTVQEHLSTDLKKRLLDIICLLIQLDEAELKNRFPNEFYVPLFSVLVPNFILKDLKNLSSLIDSSTDYRKKFVVIVRFAFQTLCIGDLVKNGLIEKMFDHVVDSLSSSMLCCEILDIVTEKFRDSSDTTGVADENADLFVALFVRFAQTLDILLMRSFKTIVTRIPLMDSLLNFEAYLRDNRETFMNNLETMNANETLCTTLVVNLSHELADTELKIFNLNLFLKSVEAIEIIMDANVSHDFAVQMCQTLKPVFVDLIKVNSMPDHDFQSNEKAKGRMFSMLNQIIKRLRTSFIDDTFDSLVPIWFNEILEFSHWPCIAISNLVKFSMNDKNFYSFALRLVKYLQIVLEDRLQFKNEVNSKIFSKSSSSSTSSKKSDASKDVLIPISLIETISDLVGYFNFGCYYNEFQTDLNSLLLTLNKYLNKGLNKNRLRVLINFYLKLFRDRSANFKQFTEVWMPHIVDIMRKFDDIAENRFDFEINDQLMYSCFNLIRILLNYFGETLSPYAYIMTLALDHIRDHFKINDSLYFGISQQISNIKPRV